MNPTISQIGSSACDAHKTDLAGTNANSTNHVATRSLTTDYLEEFFAKGLQHSCKATDELMKSIEESQDETIAREALNLYQNYYKTLDRPWDHEVFMYGLGLIYMHLNAYAWAVKSFRDAIYVRPSFPRSRDVHTRLGLIFKSAGRYDLSEKHFNLAINDTRMYSGTSTKLELMFHLAHLLELRGITDQAVELYEKLLQDKDLPRKLSANIHRQLGWIHYSSVSKSSSLSRESPRKQLDDSSSANRKLDAALDHLNSSHELDHDSQTSYYLGRCLTDVGKFQDAFAFYRSVIDKEESTADTWCSIGVLYQRQNQPWDALQAYIRSVQYDKKHAVAWMNLGILYESHNQFKDALKCYRHVLRSNYSHKNQDALQNRVNYIQKYIDDTDNTSGNSGKIEVNTDKLLTLEDLWNMESKTNQDNGASKDSGISSNSSSYTDCALISSQTNEINSVSFATAEQVLEDCKASTKLKKIDINLLNDDIKPPSLFRRHPIYPTPTRMPKNIGTSIFLESKKELTSKRLQEICQSHSISIVRNTASVLKLDLGLFSTKTLAESNPDQKIDIVSHLCDRSPDELKVETSSNNQWTCERHLSSSTISRYANYQVASFRQSLQDERLNKSRSGTSTKESETDSNESAAFRKHSDGSVKQQATPSAVPKTGSATKKFKKEESTIKFAKSACMIDLSDDKKWRPQLNELNKLPNYMKCVSASNMLTHIGLAVPGLNTVAMSMHVPGCKIIGYKTPNDFCLVNINTGPGDYEWFAVPGEYEGALRKLCNRSGCDLDRKDCWPPVQHHSLQECGIPVYRFTQRPGDLVWINSSTLYWVLATGWANCIHWNLGPLCARQFKLASETYELNKLLFRRSEVPLVQMTWNIIINIGFIADDELSWSLVHVLRQSLRYCKLIRDLVSDSEHDIELQPNNLGPKGTKYCSLCESEIFNITFVRKHDEAIHCVECARRADETFKDYTVKQEYDMNYLKKLYDTFITTKERYQELQIKQQNHQ